MVEAAMLGRKRAAKLNDSPRRFKVIHAMAVTSFQVPGLQTCYLQPGNKHNDHTTPGSSFCKRAISATDGRTASESPACSEQTAVHVMTYCPKLGNLFCGILVDIFMPWN